METKKKHNILKAPDGTEYDVDEISELTKDCELDRLKAKLFWDMVERRGGVEKFLKSSEEAVRKTKEAKN